MPDDPPLAATDAETADADVIESAPPRTSTKKLKKKTKTTGKPSSLATAGLIDAGGDDQDVTPPFSGSIKKKKKKKKIKRKDDGDEEEGEDTAGGDNHDVSQLSSGRSKKKKSYKEVDEDDEEGKDTAGSTDAAIGKQKKKKKKKKKEMTFEDGEDPPRSRVTRKSKNSSREVDGGGDDDEVPGNDWWESGPEANEVALSKTERRSRKEFQPEEHAGAIDDGEGDNAQEPSSLPEGEAKTQTFMEAAGSKALRPFVIISSCYLLFTVTDGAIRTIVLLHAFNKSFSALEVAIMFTLYELAGVFTNLAAGVMGAKWGIKFTLISGLSLQLVAFALLFGWQDEWSKEQAIVYVTFAQMFAGVAKDLTKLGGKTVTKLVTPDEKSTKLFKLVSLITGWKNSLKGVGYFLGSALLQVSYNLALTVNLGLVLLAMPLAVFGLNKSLGTAKSKNGTWSEIFTLDNPNLNWLSFARLFLFASRDFWFEVPLPFFLRSPSCEGLGVDPCTSGDDCSRGAICADDVCSSLNPGGGCGGLGLERAAVGAFLGGYIILYGQVQAWTPQLVTGPLKQTPPNKLTEILWGLINCIPTLVMWIVLSYGPAFQNYELTAMTAWMVSMIIVFAFIFAVNSSIHSFLVVHYAKSEKLAVSVGVYYMSNAMGRLFGTIGSGLLYTFIGEDFGVAAGSDAVAGLAACFLAGTLCSLMAALITVKIKDDQTGLKCGPCLTIVAARAEPTTENGVDGAEDKLKDDVDEEDEAVSVMKDTMKIQSSKSPTKNGEESNV